MKRIIYVLFEKVILKRNKYILWDYVEECRVIFCGNIFYLVNLILCGSIMTFWDGAIMLDVINFDLCKVMNFVLYDVFVLYWRYIKW